ncbi:chloride channel protein [Sulfobacillus thermosulfidooxidans]|uniref:chloride channel protein n=1 Tax=Sulfobacillus thermosulfidooxidans TaxID=28034 RepID=UPI0006B5FB17|nr:chloride channel protein [Sulfobacillus thermosulfidooxidans]
MTNVERAIPRLFYPKWEPWIVSLLAMVTGVVGGFGAIVFRWMIKEVHNLLIGDVLQKGPHPFLIFGPALGLLIVSLITHYGAREVKGHGVPQILEALALRGGKIRPRVGILGIIAPAVTIGSGGSVGREGPIALIGAAFGSTLGQLLTLPEKYTSLLLAAGSAAGIAATFNAPIAGGFFGLEIVLGSYQIGAIVPVFLAAVTGTTVFDAIMGSQAVLATPPYHVINHFALLFMMGLGLIMAIVGVLYTKGLTASEDFFDRLSLPFWAKALLGGMVVGLIGLFVPEVLGVGYPTMHLALTNQILWGALALLFVFKYLATLITIGAGGSGGVFAPSLFLGGMVGGAFGNLLYHISPNLAPHPSIYAIAGMAALFAAAAQAPFVAITILLEITGDYHLTAPVMACAAVSYLTYTFFTRDSMYTVKLRRRGIKILRGDDIRPMAAISVLSALQPLGEDAVSPSTSIHEAWQKMTALSRSFLPVISRSQGLDGIVTMRDIVAAMQQQDRKNNTVASIIQPLPKPIMNNDSLDEAIRYLSIYDVEVLPVQDSQTHHIVGLVTRSGVLKAYNASAVHAVDTSHQVEALKRRADDGIFVEVEIPNDSPMVGKQLKDLYLSEDALIVSVTRQQGAVIPHGNFAIKGGDRLLVYVAPASRREHVIDQLQAREIVSFHGV